MADKQDFSPQRNSFPSQHRSRKRKNHYIERPPHKSPTISLREKIYSHTREFLRPSIVAIISINSSEAAYFTRGGELRKIFWQREGAIHRFTVSQFKFHTLPRENLRTEYYYMFIIISRRTRELERGNHHSERPAILQLNFLDRKGQPETGCPFLLLSLSRDNGISL